MKFGPVLCQACYETLRIRSVDADEIRQPADLLRTESAIDKFLDPSDRFWYIRRIVPVAVFQSRRFNQTLRLIMTQRPGTDFCSSGQFTDSHIALRLAMGK